MSKLLRGEKVSEEKMYVRIIFNLDAPENAHLDLTDGVVVEQEGTPPPYTIGKGYEWCVNPKTGEQWFEEFDRPLTPEEEVRVAIEEQQTTQAQIIMTLVMNDLM